MSQDWRKLVEEKHSRQQATIPKDWLLKHPLPKGQLDVTKFPDTCGILSSREVEITNTDVDVLLKNLAIGSWSAVEVTNAFSKRAIVHTSLYVTNCLTEIFIGRALTRAAALDEHLRKTGTVVGPLHGYVSWIGKFAEKNSVLVDILESLGAVLYVKTNVPQTLMWPETFNNVFGRTSNPHNLTLTSGGSSGGEGALIALRGSPLGVGSDIGGSIRIPASFCGLYGLKPSCGRIPYAGCVNTMEGQESVLSVLGPLCNSLSGVKSFIQGVVGGKPWLKDPVVIKKPWNEEEYKLVDHGHGTTLCFGILWDDGMVVPHPPIIRGLETTKRALIAAGHKVIDWKPFKHAEMYRVLGEIWSAGAAEDYRVTASATGEPVIHSMVPQSDSSLESEAPFRPATDGVTAYQSWQLHKARRDLRQEYLNYWEDTINVTGTGRPVDAIISPIAAYTAVPHGTNKSANYTMVWNLLDYTALTIPVAKVDPTLDGKRPPHKFHNKIDRANYECYDDPSTYKDAPISVQLVGRTLEEEAVIAMSEIVDAALKKPSARL
ncbi:general amidase [Infundibulicybe gibba]|nr:general amidase [Infundibulicybe gibba]